MSGNGNFFGQQMVVMQSSGGIPSGGTGRDRRRMYSGQNDYDELFKEAGKIVLCIKHLRKLRRRAEHSKNNRIDILKGLLTASQFTLYIGH